MTRILVHVEGQTEETFVNEVLAPHLRTHGFLMVGARLVGNARQRNRRGGIRAWSSVRKDIVRHLLEDKNCLSTTMVDYYALPQSDARGWPGRDVASGKPFEQKALTVENALSADVIREIGGSIHARRFVPYVMMHEFEGLLFSDSAAMSRGMGKPELAPAFQRIRDQFLSPEHINDSPMTAPSKRILELAPDYEKPLMGSLAALEIGLDTMRLECPLFRAWLDRLEAWTAA